MSSKMETNFTISITRGLFWIEAGLWGLYIVTNYDTRNIFCMSKNDCEQEWHMCLPPGKLRPSVISSAAGVLSKVISWNKVLSVA